MTDRPGLKDMNKAKELHHGGKPGLCSRIRAFESRHLKRWQGVISPERAARLQIICALSFALLILLASYLLRGSAHAQTVTFLLVAVWFVPFGILSGLGSSSR